MMKNPRIEINLKKIEHNTREIVNKCLSLGISVAGVTKVFCGDIDVARAMVDGGVKYLADSRIENLEGLAKINIPKMLLRIPMISEVKDVVTFCDYSLNSEMDTIKKIALEAVTQGKPHKIIIMIDLGDLREGIWYEDYDEFLNRALELNGIEISGIGTNLTCYGGVIPTYDNLNLLSNIAQSIRKKYGIKLPMVSGGNSSSLHLIDKHEMPQGINNLRIGEAIALGRETAFGEKIDNMYDAAAVFYGEIVEIKKKPSLPLGKIGVDAFGNIPSILDMGLRHRAIIAAGRQDVNFEKMIPIDKDIKMIGASSDHLIVDITDCKTPYSLGEEISFKMSYGCLLQSMTSPYVKKIKV